MGFGKQFGIAGGIAFGVSTLAAGLTSGLIPNTIGASLGGLGTMQTMATVITANAPWLTTLGAPIANTMMASTLMLSAPLVMGAALVGIAAAAVGIGSWIGKKVDQIIGNEYPAENQHQNSPQAPRPTRSQSQNIERGTSPAVERTSSLPLPSPSSTPSMDNNSQRGRG